MIRIYFSDASIVASLGQTGRANVRGCDRQRTTTGEDFGRKYFIITLGMMAKKLLFIN